LLGAELYLGQADLEHTPTAVTLAVIKRAVGLMDLLTNVVSYSRRRVYQILIALGCGRFQSLHIIVRSFSLEVLIW